ncbi:hypothetical protein K505DRAFT_422732 [Melanomma pulvis-pyrius CBS 109.77]|uniref:Uncharacterized protein n=1 Tax=Melanomma pulvis-pyrius CBS 109.77 TaxID=1314802 RepID=A0A6A6WPC2_9PLEO|nr:hypothetical protein K505DRAFT_422732 [Melanomma pulvis-pyrius CBS 109.77]
MLKHSVKSTCTLFKPYATPTLSRHVGRYIKEEHAVLKDDHNPSKNAALAEEKTHCLNKLTLGLATHSIGDAIELCVEFEKRLVDGKEATDVNRKQNQDAGRISTSDSVDTWEGLTVWPHMWFDYFALFDSVG